jgi:hypothetical protein
LKSKISKPQVQTSPDATSTDLVLFQAAVFGLAGTLLASTTLLNQVFGAAVFGAGLYSLYTKQSVAAQGQMDKCAYICGLLSAMSLTAGLAAGVIVWEYCKTYAAAQSGFPLAGPYVKTLSIAGGLWIASALCAWGGGYVATRAGKSSQYYGK